MSSQLSFCSLEDAWNYKPPIKVPGFNATLPRNDIYNNKHKHMDANTLYSQFDDMPHFEKQKFMNMVKNTIQSTNSYQGSYKSAVSQIKQKKNQQNKTKQQDSQHIQHNKELEKSKTVSHKTNKNETFGIDQDTFHFVLLFVVGILMYYIIE